MKNNNFTLTFAQLFLDISEVLGCKFELDREIDISSLDIFIDSPTGFVKALYAVIKIDNGLIMQVGESTLSCAKRHILFDGNGSEVFAKDLCAGDFVITKNGLTKISCIKNTGVNVFYDLMVDAPHHSYYDANGLLHHNTLICAGLADLMTESNNRTLVIVPSADLVDQTVGTFRLCNLDVGIYSGAKKDIAHSIVIATWQALQNNPAVVEDFQCIIVDEAHGASAKVIGELINNHGKNCAFRFGCTGTFPKPKVDQMTLRGAIGEILYEISASQLIEMGYLAQLEIEPVEIQENVTEEFPDYGAERAFIYKNAARLDFIADLVIARAEQYGNTLVLVNSIKQGKALQKLIKNSVFLEGATDNEVRAEWYHMFEKADDLIVIATFGIASTGISIDRVFCEVLVDAGKGFIRAIQSIGRGLRKGRDKDRVHLVDVYSGLKWAKKHARERKKWYTQAQYPILKAVKVDL
ncbi:MAG: hypothetical protein DDT31_00698 [Syntrophomonadaceae bacterium]|nr:hypothetical protein [Bacillota bacterium]